jgi:hypothetical protein
MKKFVTLGFRVGVAHAAVSQRPPISLDPSVARTRGYAYDVGVWDMFIVRAFSVAPCQTPTLTHAVRDGGASSGGGWRGREHARGDGGGGGRGEVSADT